MKNMLIRRDKKKLPLTLKPVHRNSLMEEVNRMGETRVFLIIVLLLLLIVNFITGCGTARRSEPIMGKLELSNERVKHGEVVFMKNCQSCHPGGEAGIGPAINNVLLPGGVVKFRVRSKAFLLGLGRMPSFKKHEIPEGDLNDLVKYLKALRKNKPDEKSIMAKE